MNHRKSRTPQQSTTPVSLEDLFNPDKLRDILGVPQPEPVEIPQPNIPKPTPKPVRVQEEDTEIGGIWDDIEINHELPQPKQEIRETASKVASADITDVDETSADFKANRLGKSDITSDHFDKRKTATGEKEKGLYFRIF